MTHSLRDLFAAAALTRPDIRGHNPIIAAECYALADAMLRAREQAYPPEPLEKDIEAALSDGSLKLASMMKAMQEEGRKMTDEILRRGYDLLHDDKPKPEAAP